jgi:hypothetical protein
MLDATYLDVGEVAFLDGDVLQKQKEKKILRKLTLKN